MYEYKIAKSIEDKKAVFPLLLSVYEKKGYHSDAGYDESFGKYLLLPDTRIFTAWINGKLFGTVSLVPDSQEGLPMDVLNKAELELYRSQNKKIAEVTQYAIDHDILEQEGKSLNPIKQRMSSLSLFNLVLHYAFYLDLDFLVIATTPQHSLFYSSLGFQAISEKKYYPSVNTWGLAQSFDIKGYREKKFVSGIMDKILGDAPDYEMFK